MTPEEKRIAIAEWCGMVWYRHPASRNDDRVYKFLAWPGVQENEGQSEQWKVRADGTERNCSIQYMAKDFYLPDYLNDLNAMHEAEKLLDGDDRHRYSNRLLYSDNGPLKGYEFAVAHATAAQRAEALLRTIGKWTDTPNPPVIPDKNL